MVCLSICSPFTISSHCHNPTFCLVTSLSYTDVGADEAAAGDIETGRGEGEQGAAGALPPRTAQEHQEGVCVVMCVVMCMVMCVVDNGRVVDLMVGDCPVANSVSVSYIIFHSPNVCL